MSARTKRKYVYKEVLEDFSLPTEKQIVVRIIRSRGNNLHLVEAPDNSEYLVSMPTKFRKNVWVRRGNFVLVEPIEEGNKVKAEIVAILTQEHVKYYKDNQVWPQSFAEDKKTDSDDGELFENPNRKVRQESSEEEDSDEDSDNDSDDSEIDTKNNSDAVYK